MKTNKPYREIFVDIITHAGDFRKAMEIAYQHAEVRDPDIDDKAYWTKQIQTYSNIVALAKLMLGEDNFSPTGATSKERFYNLYAHAASKVQAVEEITGIYSAKYQLRSLTGPEQMAIALGEFIGQINNGGIQQYIDNGCATETGYHDQTACFMVGRLVKGTSDIDEEVSQAIYACTQVARQNLDLNSVSDSRFEEVLKKFDEAESALARFDEDRLYDYLTAAIDRVDVAKRPFIEGLNINEPASVLKI
jgi:hypothetical protein